MHFLGDGMLCDKCKDLVPKLLIKKGYILRKIIYSDAKTNSLKIIKLKELYNAEFKHVSRTFRK